MPSLTRAEAVTRAQLIGVTSYHVNLDLTIGETEFGSAVTIRFDCRRPGASTFVEIRPALLRSARLNGRRLDPASLSDNRLPLTDLADHNELVLHARMSYSNTGEGLHRFTDPADGEVYLYAQTFLDEAQRVFGCFDQPDLKAPVTLTVTAPQRWTVLANGAGTHDGLGRWSFATTPPLATYLVTVIAGRYHSSYGEHDGVPLGLHCRAALADHLDRDVAELLAVTGQCLDRYHELFGVRYPFGKYDQVFVPEFNAGAMENAACVTFRDDMVFRSAVTEAERELRAVVIAHEMAHMWFGDLVTMRWWDDLWLNESFADYFGYRVTAEATKFNNAWTTFTADRKIWGYAADQRPSTHPVATATVADTASALLNFDGISYAKGASVLRQLVAWIGDAALLAGLRAFFDRHRYRNASLPDLLAALAEASGRDLTGWAAVWLQQAQVNTVRPVIAVDAEGRYTQLTLVQTAPPAHPVLRPHRLSVGLYDHDEAGQLVRTERVDVELDPTVDGGATHVPALVGRRAAALLLANDDDLTYAKIRLAGPAAADLAAALPAITDPMARALVWSAAWDATRDAELPPAEFVSLVAAALPAETEVSVYAEVLQNTLAVAIPWYLPAAARGDALASIAACCAETLRTAPAGSGRQLAAGRGMVRSVPASGAGLLRAWLMGYGVPDGLNVDAELRWSIVHRLVVLGLAGSSDIEAELARDRSARGSEHAARCRAAVPDPAGKAAAWHSVIIDGRLSNRLLLATAEGFWQPEQAVLTADYVPRYFAEMPAVATRRTAAVLLALADAAYPQYAVEPATVAAADRMLARDGLHPGLRRVVVDRTDDLCRALAVRATADE